MQAVTQQMPVAIFITVLSGSGLCEATWPSQASGLLVGLPRAQLTDIGSVPTRQMFVSHQMTAHHSWH